MNSAVQVAHYRIGANTLYAHKWGAGKKLVLCLHGYSNNGTLFAGLPALLPDDWTVVAPDLPGHGNTIWEKPETINRSRLRGFMENLCKEQQVEQFSVLGFSLGGRFALAMLTVAPHMIRQMVLAAPDGLAPNPLLRMANNSRAGNYLLRKVLQHPERSGRLLDLLAQRRFLPPLRAQFLKYHLSAPQSKRLLGSTWLSMARMYPTTAQLAKVLKTHSIPLHLLMGISDPVIPLAHGEAFAAACPEWVTLHRLHKYHRILDAEGMALAAQLLQSS